MDGLGRSDVAAPGAPADVSAARDAAASVMASLSDHSGDSVIILSPDGVVRGINQAALEFTGWRRSAVSGRPLWAVATSGEVRDRLRAAVERAATGAVVTAHESLNDRNGRPRRIELSLSPVSGDEGSTELLVLVARDVTESERAQRELIESHEKYAGIVTIAADAIVSVDDRYRITDFNRGAEQIFGWAAEDVIGRSLEILIPHRFRAVHGEHMIAFGASPVRARRMGERREISALRSNGEEFPADASISKQTINGERFYTVVLRDITRQKRAEWSQRFLARAGSLLAASLDVGTTLESIARLAADDDVADCCVIFDATDGNVIRRAALASADPRRSDTLAEYRGESLEPASAHPAAQVVHTGQPALIPDATRLLADTAGDRDLDCMRRMGVTSAIIVPLVARGRTSGAIGLYLSSAERVFGPDDLALARELAIGAAMAVDNARLYETARRAIRARDDILAVVSHDLGNPLAAIRIGAAVLAGALADHRVPASSLEHLRGIRKSVDQMDRLIRDLMDVERIEAGPLALGAKPVRPATVVSSVIEVFNPIAAARPVALRSRVPASVPAVRADRERLAQALSNLVGNAIKFTQPGGTIEIVVEPAGESVRFSVCDNGPGIDPAHIDHIFDRFWRDARRDRGGRGGLGLGLAIVKGIVEAHGGRVWAESEPGNGTRVRFTIPTSSSTGSGPAAVRSSPTSEGDIA